MDIANEEPLKELMMELLARQLNWLLCRFFLKLFGKVSKRIFMTLLCSMGVMDLLAVIM